MVQSTDMRHALDRAGSLGAAAERCVFTQGEVRSNRVVIGRVGTQRAVQMGLVEDDKVIEAFTADRADQSLDVSVLPWTARRDPRGTPRKSDAPTNPLSDAQSARRIRSDVGNVAE